MRNHRRHSICLLLFALVLPSTVRADLFSIQSQSSEIARIDPSTGAILDIFSMPVQAAGAPDALAYSGTTLYYTSFFLSEILLIDPTTGSSLGSIDSPGGIDALAFGTSSFGATLYASSPLNQVYLLDPTTGAVRGSFTPGTDITGGLAFNGATGTLFASESSGIRPPTIHELDAMTGALLNTFTLGLRNSFGLAFDGDRLFANNVLQQPSLVEFDPRTGAILNEFPFDGFPSGLAGAPLSAAPASEPTTLSLVLIGGWLLRRRRAVNAVRSSPASRAG